MQTKLAMKSASLLHCQYKCVRTGKCVNGIAEILCGLKNEILVPRPLKVDTK